MHELSEQSSCPAILLLQQVKLEHVLPKIHYEKMCRKCVWKLNWISPKKRKKKERSALFFYLMLYPCKSPALSLFCVFKQLNDQDVTISGKHETQHSPWRCFHVNLITFWTTNLCESPLTACYPSKHHSLLTDMILLNIFWGQTHILSYSPLYLYVFMYY